MTDSEQRCSTATEPSVDEGAFWHTNMDLYYGYIPGEIVEVEHEPTKYWLARIEFSYKHLVLLKWLGNYGEDFWIDTSPASSATTGSSGGDNSFFKDYPKRLFTLGHHLQSQIKSQFKLEKPIQILIKPSLYNPAKDPYAEIKTVEDLLAYEADPAHNGINEPASLALVKGKTKINYKQEDVDELEAALQNLTHEIGGEQAEVESRKNTSSSLSLDLGGQELEFQGTKLDDSSNQNKDSGHESDASNNHSDQTADTIKGSDGEKLGNSVKPIDFNTDKNLKIAMDVEGGNQVNKQQGEIDNDEKHIDLCKRLQESAMTKGRYMGIKLARNDQCKKELYFLKPKQFFDLGGANHERVLVPGTLVEMCHSIDTPEGLSIYHWFAFVIKNVGGRLTLRWFLCDEPKFKQGRLEIKSCRSRFIQEEDDSSNTDNANQDEDTKRLTSADGMAESADRAGLLIPAKSLIFSVHFCDPKLHNISYAKHNGRAYKFPQLVSSQLSEISQSDCASGSITAQESMEKAQIDHIFDPRRMNLDRDRPLIGHILSTARQNTPNYLDLIFAPKDTKSRREILISCPKMTKLIRGHIMREIEPNIFEIHSEPLEGGEVIKFIHPFDNSYAILPLNWADNNQDCLSIAPSRNASPTVMHGHSDQKKSSNLDHADENRPTNSEYSESHKSLGDAMTTEQGSDTYCLASSRAKFPRAGGSFHRLPSLDEISIPELKKQISIIDQHDPHCWMKVLRSFELDAPSFHCCIDTGMKRIVEDRFKVMDQLEVVHPSSDSTICSGRIRKVVYPLLWIQISADSYTLLPFNSTNIYPARWCKTHQHNIVSFLPPRKRHIDRQAGGPSSQTNDQKKRKKIKINEGQGTTPDSQLDFDQIYVKESFDLGSLNDKQTGIDYLLNENSMYIKIYFNHKCFTGPSLSKSKISTLPQYVGPGPMRLVIEEVVTKVISVAYVPPRILNELSSKSFEELLVQRNLKNTTPMEFKAKYQKRVHREKVPVCLNPDDVTLYCECLCEHLKCCYNLFGPHQYDGDDCPGHCRQLTKSNKFMKRATYYRDKARAGEFLGNGNPNSHDNQVSKKTGGKSNSTTSTSRPRSAAQGSSESTSSSVSRSDRAASRASSSSGEDNQPNGDVPGMNLDLNTAQGEREPSADIAYGIDDRNDNNENICNGRSKQTRAAFSDQEDARLTTNEASSPPESRGVLKKNNEQIESDLNAKGPIDTLDIQYPDEMQDASRDSSELIASDPNEWTVDDVCRALDVLGLSIFARKMKSECIDGRALLLLDDATIEEHFQKQSQIDFAPEELVRFCRFVEFTKVRLAS